MLNKLKAFYSSPPVMRKLFIEACLYLAWARIVKRLPFDRLAQSLGVRMEETPFTSDPQQIPTLRQVAHALHVMRRYVFWECHCLVMAVAAMKMLERRHIDSTLYLGTAKDDKGRLIAHAWLRSGSVYVTGADGLEKFVIVGIFSKYAAKINSVKDRAYER